MQYATRNQKKKKLHTVLFVLHNSSSGFTLIELLIVMIIIIILSSIITFVCFDKIKFAGDTVAMQDISQYARAIESYTTTHNGYYPASFQDLVDSGDISVLPHPYEGYTYTMSALPAGCAAGVSCMSVVITSPLKAVANISMPYERFESTSGKTCQTATAGTPCP